MARKIVSLRYGSKEPCHRCNGSGLLTEERHPVVYLSSPMPRGRVSLCRECKARGTQLYVWHKGACVPLAQLASSEHLQHQVAL